MILADWPPHYSAYIAHHVVAGLPQPVRGASLAKGPDSSVGEVHRGSCFSNIHMEEKVKDQEDEVEDGRDKRRVRRGSKRDQTHRRRMTHG